MSNFRVKVKIDNTYSTGTITTTPTITVPMPDDPSDLNEWFEEHVWPHTGTSANRSNDYAIYEAEIIGCAKHPWLIGKTYSWGD